MGAHESYRCAHWRGGLDRVTWCWNKRVPKPAANAAVQCGDRSCPRACRRHPSRQVLRVRSHACVGAVFAGIGGGGGVVTGSVVRRYAALFERFTTVPMSDLTPPGKWDKTVMRAHSWQQGALRFTFLVDPPSPRIEWDNFQVARRVLWLRIMCSSADAGCLCGAGAQAHLSVFVVIGICHCPSSADLLRAYSDFEKTASQCVLRCCVTAWHVSHTGPCLGLRPIDVAAGMHGHCRSSASVLTR